MKAKEFDKKINHQVNKVENKVPAGVAWDIDKSWRRINSMLKASKGKLMIWYLSLAATVSLVLGNVVELTLPSLPNMQDSIAIVNASIAPDKKTLQPAEEVDDKSRTRLTLSQVKPKKATLHSLVGQSSSTYPTAKMLLQEARVEETFRKEASHFKLEPIIGFGVNGNKSSLIGEVDVIYTFNSHHINHLGLALEGRRHLALSQTLYDDEYVYGARGGRAIYLSLVAGRATPDNQWRLRVGLPVLTKNEELGLKVGYQRTIQNKLNVGPEVIFSKDFKKIYPGITLSFG